MKRSLVLLLLIQFGIGAATQIATGEEFLIQKNGAKYLGWRVDKAEFKTCAKDSLKVADGRIAPTNDKCPTNEPPPFVFTEGKVERVDAMAGKIQVVTPGEKLQLEMKGADSRKILEVLKPGDDIGIKYSTKGLSAVLIEKK